MPCLRPLHLMKLSPWVLLGALFFLVPSASGQSPPEKPSPPDHRPLLASSLPKANERASERVPRLKGRDATLRGLRFYLGSHQIVDYNLAFKASKEGCEKGDGAGCFRQGQILKQGLGRPTDPIEARLQFARAHKLCKPACEEKGDALCCYSLGFLYAKGWGIKLDLKVAYGYYKKACAMEEPLSCSNLGRAYYEAEGVAQDYKKSHRYYKKSCDLKHGAGCHNLAILYSQGQGVSVDKATSRRLYQRACGLGEGDSCSNLGVIYQEGEDLRQDIEKAKLYYKRACDLRRGTGCYNLAVLYHIGKGTRKNCREAGKYYRLACRYGFVNACSETCN